MKQTLYKYCSVSTSSQMSRAIDLLNGRIYFSAPANFNDPFELSAKVNISSSPLLGTLSQKEKNEILRIFRLRPPTALSDDWKEKVGILCLSEDPANILMWSHYSNNHSGICIGFDTDQKPFSSAKMVNYSDERPAADFNSDSEKLFSRVLLTKSKHWSYEREWRSIKRTIESEELNFYYKTFENSPDRLDEIASTIEENGGPGLYSFEKSAIRSIFLGSKITSDNQEQLIQAVRSACPQAKIFQMELDHNYFWLNRKRYK